MLHTTSSISISNSVLHIVVFQQMYAKPLYEFGIFLSLACEICMMLQCFIYYLSCLMLKHVSLLLTLIKTDNYCEKNGESLPILKAKPKPRLITLMKFNIPIISKELLLNQILFPICHNDQTTVCHKRKQKDLTCFHEEGNQVLISVVQLSKEGPLAHPSTNKSSTKQHGRATCTLINHTIKTFISFS